jgi:hypothetical protein
MGAVVWAALVIGYAQKNITGTGLGIVVGLGAFLVMLLNVTLKLRRKTSLLERITPPRRPNLAAWVVVSDPVLLAGWIGYQLPGSGDDSIQSDLLFGALTGFGIVWPPAVSALVGVRTFVQLAREEL